MSGLLRGHSGPDDTAPPHPPPHIEESQKQSPGLLAAGPELSLLHPSFVLRCHWCLNMSLLPSIGKGLFPETREQGSCVE